MRRGYFRLVVALGLGLLVLSACSSGSGKSVEANLSPAEAALEDQSHPVIAGLERDLGRMIGSDPDLQRYTTRSLLQELAGDELAGLFGSAGYEGTLTDLQDLLDFSGIFNDGNGVPRLVLLVSPS